MPWVDAVDEKPVRLVKRSIRPEQTFDVLGSYRPDPTSQVLLADLPYLRVARERVDFGRLANDFRRVGHPHEDRLAAER